MESALNERLDGWMPPGPVARNRVQVIVDRRMQSGIVVLKLI
jgi:hypothetical protein